MTQRETVNGINIVLGTGLDDMMRYPVGRYLNENLSQIESIASLILIEYSRELKPRPDVNLICRGSSGAIIAALVLQKLSKEGIVSFISHVKKEGESSHNTVIYVKNADFNVIVDDFISSGETVNAIYEEMSKSPYIDGLPRVDILAVSARVTQKTLLFEPKTIICGRYYK